MREGAFMGRQFWIFAFIFAAVEAVLEVLYGYQFGIIGGAIVAGVCGALAVVIDRLWTKLTTRTDDTEGQDQADW